jgi:hypothetical protein
MPKESASVTEKGIYFRKLYYSCPEAREALWFENARKNGRYSVDVSYDPRDMSLIYVWKKDGGGTIPCTLLDWEQRFSGKSAEEVVFEQKKQEILKKKGERAEREAVINLNRRIDAIVQAAEEMMPSSVEKTKAEKLANIRENRKEEKDSIRAEEAFTSDDTNKASRTDRDNPKTGVQDDPFTITPEEWEKMSPIDRMIYQDVKRRQENDTPESES